MQGNTLDGPSTLLIPEPTIRRLLLETIRSKERQGHVVDGLEQALDSTEGYDALAEFAERLVNLDLRPDWPYVEPDDLGDIEAQSDRGRLEIQTGQLDPETVGPRIEAAFAGLVAGCILGKPIEVVPTLEELQDTARRTKEGWPLNDFVSEQFLSALGRRHPDWRSCIRGRIQYVPPDDDTNFRVMGMLLLEEYGARFTKEDVLRMWLENLPQEYVFASNRTFLIKAALHWTGRGVGYDSPGADLGTPPLDEWVRKLNPYDEDCGAIIRVDAYGYASPGDPVLAARLAWRDASLTHRRTGTYSSMFAAAAIAAAFTATDPLEPFEVALGVIPSKSRLFDSILRSLEIVGNANTWESAYQQIHTEFKDTGHCLIYQELGTVFNTLKFASDIGDGIGLQVSQGNDTDSFGALAGSLLGIRFGPEGLEDRWLRPFNDDFRTTLATFDERSLQAVLRRMGDLPSTLGPSDV